MVHLGHGGKPCLAGGYQDRGVPNDFEEDWEDLEEHAGPPHLTAPKDQSCLTVVHTSGVHFCDVRYCSCPGSEDSHLQLACADLFPATTKQPRTAFTFQMLDEFIQDNMECGTSAMNFYSKLWRNTSNVFPHLVPVSHHLSMPQKFCRNKTGLILGNAVGVPDMETVKTDEMARLP